MEQNNKIVCPYCGSERVHLSKEEDAFNPYAVYECEECKRLFDKDDCEHEEYWHQISALLNGTSIEKPLVLNSYVILPSVEDESCGLSDLEKLNIDKVHQIEGEGTMWYHFEGTPETDDYWYDMSELDTRDLKYLLEELRNL